MKFIINLLFLLLSSCALSQEYTIDLRMTSSEDGESMVADIHLAKKTAKLYASFNSLGMSEVFIVDSTQKKVLELIDEDGEKEAYISSSILTGDVSDYGLTLLYDMLSGEAASSEDYRLLTETKVMHGVQCRKVELLEEGLVVGTGWILPGMRFGLGEDKGLFLLQEGMLVEMELIEGSDTFRLEFIGMTKGPVNNAQFSLAVPVGYELMDDTEE